jgi:hypothetical protein
VRQLWQNKQYSHAPYNPDTKPCDFNCFGFLKLQLKGKPYAIMNQLNNTIQISLKEGNHKGTFNGVK